MPNFAAVGASASAPKSKVMSNHDEVFDNRVSIRKLDDGTFHISAAMKKVPKKGVKDPFPHSYCPDQEFSADTLGEAFEKARGLFG